MTEPEAKSILEDIERAGQAALTREVVTYAIAYARIRVDWQMADLDAHLRKELKDAIIRGTCANVGIPPVLPEKQ